MAEEIARPLDEVLAPYAERTRERQLLRELSSLLFRRDEPVAAFGARAGELMRAEIDSEPYPGGELR